MKDPVFRKPFRPVVMPMMLMMMLFCSFQCTDLSELMMTSVEGPKIELLKKKEIPLWPVYSASENLPSTNIFFVVWDLSADVEVWAECPDGDLKVEVTPVCTRYTLSVWATERFDGSSSVKILARDGDMISELPVTIELADISPAEEEVVMTYESASYSIPVDANINFDARTYDDWITVNVEDGNVNFSVAENAGGEPREGIIRVYDIYEVVTAEIAVRQGGAGNQNQSYLKR